MAILGYWKTRGLGQPIRMMLYYSGVKYEQVLYEHGPPPDYEKKYWLQMKYNLDLPFPNLPYYIQGSTKLTQQLSIMLYIASKYQPQLIPSRLQRACELMTFGLVVKDIRQNITKPTYNPNYALILGKIFQKQQKRLEKVGQFLQELKEPLWTDFLVYQVLDQIDAMNSGLLQSVNTSFKIFKERFIKQYNLETYLSHPRHPFNTSYFPWSK